MSKNFTAKYPNPTVGTVIKPIINDLILEDGGSDFSIERLAFIWVERSAAPKTAGVAVEHSEDAVASGLISLPQASQIRVKVLRIAPQ
jgi:hypothetical protein